MATREQIMAARATVVKLRDWLGSMLTQQRLAKGDPEWKQPEETEREMADLDLALVALDELEREPERRKNHLETCAEFGKYQYLYSRVAEANDMHRGMLAKAREVLAKCTCMCPHVAEARKAIRK